MIQRRLYRLSFLPSSLRRCLLFLRYGTMRSIPRFASRSSRTPSGRPSPSTSTIHFVPLPRLVLPTAEPLFPLERSCRPGTSLPTSADLRHRAHPVAFARRRATHPALPTASTAASRSQAKGTCRPRTSTPPPSATPPECPPDSPASTPTDGLPCPSPP